MSEDKPASTAVLNSQSQMPEEGLGERVRQVREQLGLTHDGLSNLTKSVDIEGRGISRTTIRGYELGTYKPGSREIRILSAALRKSPTWLVIGTDDGNGGPELVPGQSNSGVRWANLAFPVLAFFQLGKDEKQQVVSLVETLLRLQIGELRFRSTKGFIEDFADTIQDALRDKAQYRNDPGEIRAVFIATVEEMKKRHGAEEANLLMATMEPIFDFWESSTR